MPKVTDIAYGRIASPDLDVQEEFLTHFGMTRSARTDTALYMRGTDPDHHIHVTELADEPRFVGLAFYAASEADLDEFAKIDGASGVEDIDEPGGGKRVRLTEPNGYQIEVVHGIEMLDPLDVARQPVNDASDNTRREGDLMRIKPGPSTVKRIGHSVIMTPDLKGSIPWYRENLGLVCSDDIYVENEDNIIATFNRIDAGEEFVDHHVFLCVQGEVAGLNHMAFEVQDIDDVIMGHHYFKTVDKYEHMWGLGRHVLGSQVYDYWCDPWGRVHEHWTDSDRLNNKNKANIMPAEDGLNSQWGEPAPDKFIGHSSP